MDRQLLALFVRRYRSNLALVAVASVLLNVLVFAGTGYLMLVYDSVLPSRSVPTLVGLFVMLVLVYVFQSVFEAIRAEALLALAGGVHDDLFAAVHHATITRALRLGTGTGAGADDGLQFTRDLDAVHAFLAGPGLVALIDLPWVVLFMAVLTALHWWLGLAAGLGVAVIALLALWSNRRTQEGARDLAAITNRRSVATLAEIRFAESALAMGMQERLVARTLGWETRFITAQAYLARTISRFGGATRMVRMLLQSAILTVGALLVIDDRASGGVILASSVLSGRALAPVDQAIAQWRSFASARSGWARLVMAIGAFRRPPARSVMLDRPSGALAVRDLWVTPPGTQRFTVTGASFTLEPGDALAVVGPSAAGKTSLVRAILGIWEPARGEIRIGGATPAQWDSQTLGSAIGYVAQTVDLIDGTVAENIARFDPEATSAAVIAAARAAGMHETILAMPDGYDTPISAGGCELSAGQRQRIGLARALYGDPWLLVLDEANSNLDTAGDGALAAAVVAMRQRGGIVIMITHRPATLGPINLVAVMQHGRMIDFGPRDEVLQRTMAPPAPTAGATPAVAAGGGVPGLGRDPGQPPAIAGGVNRPAFAGALGATLVTASATASPSAAVPVPQANAPPPPPAPAIRLATANEDLVAPPRTPESATPATEANPGPSLPRAPHHGEPIA